MNKQTFISKYTSWLSATGYTSDECHVSHGGSMLMMGLREETDDIDVTVTQAIWDDLIDKGYTVKVLPANGLCTEVSIISVTENIDVHVLDWDWDGRLVLDAGIWYRDAETTLEDKIKLSREKDMADIQKLKEYLFSMRRLKNMIDY